MSSSNKIYLYRDFTASVYWGPLPSYDPIPLPLHTVYVYTVYLFTQGRGEGGVGSEPERRSEGQQFKSWVENTNMTNCISSL